MKPFYILAFAFAALSTLPLHLFAALSTGLATLPLHAADLKTYDGLIESANEAREQNKDREAFEFAHAAQKLDDRRFEAYYLLSKLTRDADLTVSRKFLAEAFKRSPVENRAVLAKVLSSTDRLIADVKEYHSVIMQMVQHVETAKTPAERKHRLEVAIGASRRFLKTAPNFPDIWLAVASGSMELNDEPTGRMAAQGYLAAIAESEKVAVRKSTKKNPKDAVVVANLRAHGWIEPNAADSASGQQRSPAQADPTKP